MVLVMLFRYSFAKEVHKWDRFKSAHSVEFKLSNIERPANSPPAEEDDDCRHQGCNLQLALLLGMSLEEYLDFLDGTVPFNAGPYLAFRYRWQVKQ